MANLPCEISTLTIPARSSYAGVAAAYLTAVAGLLGFAPDLARQLGQALRLILIDLCQQAFPPGDRQELIIAGERQPLGLQVRIGEQGLPLSSGDLASLAPAPPACPLLLAGSRLVCVREVWDEASFHNLGRAGAEILLVKYFPGAPAPDAALCPPPPPAVTRIPPAGPPETFHIRPFQPEDAMAITRLVYRTYAYSYPFEHLYYPERLIALNAEGSLRSFVAASTQDEIAGHLAMFFPQDQTDLVEIGAAFVHPDFRGHGCLRQLVAAALAAAEAQGLPALVGRPVTNHPYSQKVVEDLGFVPCGVLVGFASAAMSFKKIHEDLGQRESILVVYRRLLPWSPGIIYPPPAHRDLILKIYGWLGLAPQEGRPEADMSSTAPGALKIRSHQTAGIAIIQVAAIGADTLPELTRTLKHLCRSRFEAILLELDLRQPATPHLTEQCEALGFFFAGLLPRPHGPQALVLQYLNNVPLDYDKIQLSSPRAQEILAYIKARDPNLI